MLQDEGKFLEDEWYQVRHSGELPEIALHSSIFFLTCDTEGPRMVLDDQQSLYLKQAARDRFQEIVLRDLLPENRDKTIYRGIKRTIANWRRYERFCQRQGFLVETFRREVAQQLKQFLIAEQNVDDVCEGQSGLNCSYDDLLLFAEEIGMSDCLLIEPLRERCCFCKEE